MWLVLIRSQLSQESDWLIVACRRESERYSADSRYRRLLEPSLI